MIMKPDITHTGHGLENPPGNGGNYAASQQDDLQQSENTLRKDGNCIRLHGAVVLIRRKKLEEILGLSRSTIYRRKNKKSKGYDPTFPQPIPYGTGRAVRWIAEEVADWIEAQIRLSRKVNNPSAKATKSQPAG